MGEQMKSHIEILNRLLSVIPDAACETSIVGAVAVSSITYKGIDIVIKQVGDDAHCELSSESLELSIKTSDIDLCADELVRHLSRIVGRPNYSTRLVPTMGRSGVVIPKPQRGIDKFGWYTPIDDGRDNNNPPGPK